MVEQNISTPSPAIAAHHKRWKRNRDALAGQDAIRDAGIAYLPLVYTGQSAEEYASYQSRVVFYPATQKTLENHIGLIFRKPPHLEAEPSVTDILATITARYGLDDLSRELLGETLATNFTGLLVDNPPAKDGLSVANAISSGQRPFLSVFQAESVLEVTKAIVANKFAIVRVRLLDDADTVRELRLIEDRYEVIMHRRINQLWVEDAPIVPVKDGKALNFIPFEIVSTEAGCTSPPKAPLDDLVNLNLAHYLATADLSNVIRCIGHPIRFVTGVKLKDEAGNAIAPQFIVRADQVWVIDDPQGKVGISEHSGAGVAALRDHRKDIADHMAQVGARILASEKVAVEAADTLAIRRASENSILASLANRVSSHIERQVNFALDWAKLPTIAYRLNTDFLPMPMSAQDITAMLAVVQAGRMSAETFFGTLQAGEIVNDSLTFDEEQSRIERDNIDRPPTDPI